MESELIKAIEEQCSIKALQKILSDVKNVNLKNSLGETALHIVMRKWLVPICDVDFQANESKIVKAVQLLTDAGADVNSKNGKGQSVIEVLLESIYRGEKLFEILGILIKAGADVNSKNNYGRTALHLAAKDESNRVDFIRLLLKRDGVDVELQDYKGITALQYAIRKLNPEVVKCLIKAGADVKREISDGYSLLHLATKNEDNSEFTDDTYQLNRREIIVNYLINAGADVNLKDKNGETPLHLAVKGTNSGLIFELLNGGANVNVVSYTDGTPLNSFMWSTLRRLNCARYFFFFKITLDKLLNANANVNPVEVTFFIILSIGNILLTIFMIIMLVVPLIGTLLIGIFNWLKHKI